MRRVLLVLAVMLAEATAASAFEPHAGLIAGSGAARATDGAALSAAFLKPVALAYGPHGELYVADQAANRVVTLSHGLVRRLSGGTRGFQNGAAIDARFDGPAALLALPGGALLVADAGNACVRIVRDGVVSTFAGIPMTHGHVDGAVGVATFRAPVALSTDGDDGFYVADLGGGLRHLDAAGDATTVVVPGLGLDIQAVAATRHNGSTTIVLADRRAAYFYHPETHEGQQLFQDDDSGEPVGNIADIIAISRHEFVYADPGRHAVRYLYFRDDATGPYDRQYAFPLTGFSAEDAAQAAGADVPGAGGPFLSPEGLALAPDGSVTVADASARKLRSLAMPDRRTFSSTAIAELGGGDGTYRIAYVSNSMALRNTTFDDSIGGTIERVLNRDRASIGLTAPVRVVTFRLQAGFTSTASFASNVLGEGLTDEVVWGFNQGFFSREIEQYPLATAHDVQLQTYASIVGRMKEALYADRIGLIAFDYPIGGGFGPGSFYESLWAKDLWLDTLGPLAESFPPEERDAETVFSKAGVPFDDLYPAIWALEDAKRPDPLFGTSDGHATPYGYRAIGELMAREIERQRPWLHSPVATVSSVRSSPSRSL